MKKLVSIFLGILFLSLGCTRDDICTEETSKTPLLIIRFYNAQEPEVLKSVTNFTITPVGDSIAFYEPQTLDSIAIPLKTSTDLTEYVFFANASDSIPNADVVSFSYERENEFINRACGFRTNFKNLNFNLNSPTQQSWIDYILIKSDSVNARNQNETHLTIFH